MKKKPPPKMPTKLKPMYWDYGPGEYDGTPVEVEIVPCAYNDEVRRRLETPTPLTEIFNDGEHRKRGRGTC